MKRHRANAFVIGAFVVGAIAVLVAGLIALPGNRWFNKPQRIVMFFTGSIFGLQKGAPVVFRGVRVGSVTGVDVYYEPANDSFAIPVIAELDEDAVRGLNGIGSNHDLDDAVPDLVKRGMSAQLGTQSLLTGQLYVDLDIRPKQRGTVRGGFQGATEIPTVATAFQALKTQLESIDLRHIVDDLSQISNAARAFATSPQLKQGLQDFGITATHLRKIAAQLEKRVGPLGDTAQKALGSVDRAGDKVSRAADSVGTGADRASALLAPDGAVVRDLQRALDELARASSSLREATDGDGPLLQQTERTMRDLSGAARALRQLANSLEAQPDSLLRGRKPDPALPASPTEPAR